MKKIYTLTIALVFATAGLFAQSMLLFDFEDANIGDPVEAIGWGEMVAEIADDPLATGNMVLKFTPNNYNAAPLLTFTLEAGKTLADYSTFKFKGYFAQGDVGWKTIKVGVSQETPTGVFDHGDYSGTIVGSFYREQGASTEWELITLDISNALELSGTVYVVFGINTDGTGDGLPTIWYADDVELVAGNATSTPSLFDNKSDIYTKGNAVIINNCLGKRVAIYSISGTNVFTQKATSSTITAQLPLGLYIVEIDGRATKVIVK